MTPEQFARVESLFDQAAELPANDRTDWLSSACPDDPVVRRKVEGMLSADERVAARLEKPAFGPTFTVAEVDGAERRLRDEFAAAGRYVIQSFLGEGGFGGVYRAEQQEPVRRPVALKVIKPGMDSRRVLARFEQERQTLAMMNHPGIARVFDAGMTVSGRPFVAMELIDGRSIADYADTERLGLRARLEIFVQVCEAVRHAHQKGVIHRDIKPSNVLVAERDGAAMPVIIDFGIARALFDDSRERSLHTEQGQMIGTPEYMSPEQARGDADIDTRADIYALGVLLYKLLTGTTPLVSSPDDRAGPLELCRRICEDEPEPPSRRVAKADAAAAERARARLTDPSGLSRALRGDLDVIVMKALEKNRARRYATVDELASDMRRYLRDDTVLARPPTAGYRLGKFARRHRGALAAGIGMAILLVAGVIGTLLGWARSYREAEIARNESSIARAVTGFLNDDLLAAVAPDELGNDALMRDVVAAAAKRLEGKFADQPLVEAAVRLSIGRTYSKLADYAAAQQHLERCLLLRTALLGSDALDTLAAEKELAQIYMLQDRNADSERLFRHVYEGRRTQLGEMHADTISSLYDVSVAIAEQGRLAEAEPLLMGALERCRAQLGDRSELTLTILRGAGVLKAAMGDGASSGRYYEEVYRTSRTMLGPEHHMTLLSSRDYAIVLMRENRPAEAEKLLYEALPISRRQRGERHPATLMLMDQLATVLNKQGRSDEAETMLVKALDAARQSLPAGHSVTTILQFTLGEFYAGQKRHAEAEPLLLECIASRERTLGPEHPWTIIAIRSLINQYHAAGTPAKADLWISRLHADLPAIPTE